MTSNAESYELEWNAEAERSPFAEAPARNDGAPARAVGFAPWSQNFTPFAEAAGEGATQGESDRAIAEAFAELRDETFDEAVAALAEETEQAVADRFASESPAGAAERERYADAQLSGVRFEAQQYLNALEAGVAGKDLESLADEQLDEMLDRYDPAAGELTPAGEEFIGALVRKAKKAVKGAINAAKNIAGTAMSIAGKAAGALVGPVLKKLRDLINPLLRRVLSFAIGRLPAALQPVARTLASRITSEAGEEESEDEGPVSPAQLTDVEALAESFDAALAEAIAGESVETGEAMEAADGRELEALAEARGALIDRLRAAGDEEDLGPAVEQFVPALLGALRVGIRLIGRPKIVRFLARYVGQLIRRWVGPTQSGPLANAIVDTGLRLISLEAEAGESRSDETAPVALASVVEDTVRRLAENEDYVLENEDLAQLAIAEAFSHAVATHFPPRFVRADLQQAPSLGGAFVARRPRSIRTYRKYSRIPEVEITAQIADALPTFGGTTLGAALRAAGATFPLRARVHVYESVAGTTLPRMIRLDRPGAGRGYVATSNVHPLSPHAAGLLFREPRLGAAVPAAYLRSRQRIAAGQRFFSLETAGAPALPASTAAARIAPSRAWTRVDARNARITVGLYLSETEAQGVATAIRQGRGGAALLQALAALYRTMRHAAGHRHRPQREGEERESLAARLPGVLGHALRRRLRAWVLPALATWVRNNGEAFLRAAAHPDAGVTVRVALTAVPGLGLSAGAVGAALRGTPAIAISVQPGSPRQ